MKIFVSSSGERPWPVVAVMSVITIKVNLSPTIAGQSSTLTSRPALGVCVVFHLQHRSHHRQGAWTDCGIPALRGFAAAQAIYLTGSRCPSGFHPFRYPHTAPMDQNLNNTDPSSVSFVPYLHVAPHLLVQGMPAPLGFPEGPVPASTATTWPGAGHLGHIAMAPATSQTNTIFGTLIKI